MFNFKVFYLIPVIFLIYDCGGIEKRSYPQALKADEKLVYLEAHDLSSSKYAFDFCDVTILDLRSVKRFYITNDIFYDQVPAISNDGSLIAFLSAREEDRISLRIRGIGAKQSLFVYDSASRKLRKFYIDQELGDNFIFFRNNNELIFIEKRMRMIDGAEEIYTPGIMSYNIKTKKYKQIKKFDNLDIRELILSPKQKYLLIGCWTTIKVWELATDNMIDIKVLDGSNIGGFNREETKFLFQNFKNKKLYEFDVNSMDSTEIELPSNSDWIFPFWDFYYLKNGNIVGFTTKVPYPADKDAVEIVVLDRKLTKYKFLTNDGLHKYDLRYWSK